MSVYKRMEWGRRHILLVQQKCAGGTDCLCLQTVRPAPVHGAWVGERTGRHEEESGGGLCHDCGRDIPDWLCNQEYLRPCEHGYGRCVGRGHHCQGTVVCSSVADQYSVKYPVICSRILFLRLAVYQAHPCSPRSCSLFPCMFCREASYLGNDLFLSALFGES